MDDRAHQLTASVTSVFTLAVTRSVPQRSFRGRHQPFRAAAACSPRQRNLAWVLLYRRRRSLRRRPRKGTGMMPSSP
ncbi:hypothetical protein DMH12_01260 [Streptomyces sp. WAC 04229]|nr:hypothetical protein DMH12_01260 [Streptomyces sp. WAC 04229]